MWWHRPYYIPSPSLGPGLPRVSLISTLYPWGAQVRCRTSTGTCGWPRSIGRRWSSGAPTGDTVAAPEHGRRRRDHPAPGPALGLAAARGRYAEAAGRGRRSTTPPSTPRPTWRLATPASAASGCAAASTSPGGTRRRRDGRPSATDPDPAVFLHSRASPGCTRHAPPARLRRRWSCSVSAPRLDLGYLLSPEMTVRAAHTALRASAADHRSSDRAVGHVDAAVVVGRVARGPAGRVGTRVAADRGFRCSARASRRARPGWRWRSRWCSPPSTRAAIRWCTG